MQDATSTHHLPSAWQGHAHTCTHAGRDQHTPPALRLAGARTHMYTCRTRPAHTTCPPPGRGTHTHVHMQDATSTHHLPSAWQGHAYTCTHAGRDQHTPPALRLAG